MKSVKEVSMITGITEQNIRYYEKKGLLSPERNRKNSYREYSDRDIDRLKMILLFTKIAEDYTAVVKLEMVRTFSFMPDVPCGSPGEFTDELLKYADQENLDIVITKEGMSPHFLMNGIEYRAYRTSGRFGITIHCEMVHPEDYIPEGMSEKKYRIYRTLSFVGIPVLGFFTVNFWVFREAFKSWVGLLMVLIAIILYTAEIYFVYYCYGKNYKG